MATMIRSASLTGFAALARLVGLDPQRLIAEVGLPAGCLQTPEMMIPARAVGQLLELTASASGAEDFGLRLAETRELSKLGAVALVAREEPTIGRALEAFTHYQHLLKEASALRVERSEGVATISEVLIGQGPAPTRQLTELTLGVLFRVLQTLLGSGWRPQAVCFTHRPPAKLATHRRVFGARIEFGRSFDGILCDERDLDRPQPRSDPAIACAVRQYLEELLACGNVTLTEKVRETLTWMLPSGNCSLDSIAAQLGFESRALRRRLAREGQSFAALLDEVRAHVAMQLVENRAQPLSDAAAQLGFSEPSAFSRWFHARFGCSPTMWRAAR